MNFIATVVIILILTVFVLVSSMMKVVTKNHTGETIYSESRAGIDGGVGYMDNYAKLVEVRQKIGEGLSLDNAIKEAGYER